MWKTHREVVKVVFPVFFLLFSFFFFFFSLFFCLCVFSTHFFSIFFAFWVCFFTKASCQAWLKLLIANEVRIGGLGGGVPKPDHLRQFPNHLGWPRWSVLRPMYQVAIGWRWGSIPPWSVHGRALGGSKQKKSNGRTRITRKDWSKVKHRSLQGEGWGGEECKECRVRYGRSLTCIGGEGQNIRKALEELEQIGMPSKAV